MTIWRLLFTPPASGALNMALDEAIMRCRRGDSLPTLRLYTWAPACLTVGYFQSVVKDIDLDGCRRLDIDLVRRPTGGRAVLHDNELTYSVVGSLADPCFSGSVNESYSKIAEGIREGLRLLGVQVDKSLDRALARTACTGACFEAAWGHETTVQGCKLVASAQTRHGGVVLQHGSILLAADAAMLASVLKTRDKAGMAILLKRRLVTLSGLLARPVPSDEVAAAVRRGFERALGTSFEVGRPTDEESALAARLVNEKYANPEWNLRR